MVDSGGSSSSSRRVPERVVVCVVVCSLLAITLCYPVCHALLAFDPSNPTHLWVCVFVGSTLWCAQFLLVAAICVVVVGTVVVVVLDRLGRATGFHEYVQSLVICAIYGGGVAVAFGVWPAYWRVFEVEVLPSSLYELSSAPLNRKQTEILLTLTALQAGWCGGVYVLGVLCLLLYRRPPADIHAVLESLQTIEEHVRKRQTELRRMPSLGIVRLISRDLEDVESQSCTCPICLETMRGWDVVVFVQPCGHAFHEKCLAVWGGVSAVCPVCRGRRELPKSGAVTGVINRTTSNPKLKRPLLDTL